MNRSIEQGRVAFRRADETLIVDLLGAWHLGKDVPSANLLTKELSVPPAPKKLSFESSQLSRWDGGFIAFLVHTSEICRACGVDDNRDGLPVGLRRLLELAEAVPEKKGARSDDLKTSFFTRIGNATIGSSQSVVDFLAFVGELTQAFGKFLRRKARYRTIDLLEAIEQCGASAVGILTLIAFLVGFILAFMGAVQLSQFGASIYVADLVGIGIVREMAAMTDQFFIHAQRVLIAAWNFPSPTVPAISAGERARLLV